MTKPKDKTYRQLADELSGILDWFESDKVELDEAIAKYKQAAELIQQMETYLKTAENKVQKITSQLK
jgi:exodeoxyribonuclease VII small subunit